MNPADPTSPPSSADYSISAIRANVVGFAITIPVLVGVGLALQTSQAAPVWDLLMRTPLVTLLIAVVIGCVIHELLHAVGFVYWGKCRRSEVSFGMNWKALSPFAHCSAPMSAGAYRKAALLPGVLLGVVPMLVGFYITSVWLILFGAIMLIIAIGDVLLVWLIRSVPAETLILDHPTRVGCVVPQI